MKKLFFVSVLSITSLLSYSQNASEGYVIDGTIKGNTENAKVALLDQASQSEEPINSTVVKNNKFKLKGKVDGSGPYIITITLPDTTLSEHDRMLGAEIYIENTNMTFDADAATMTSYYYNPKRKGIPVITGSASHDLSNKLGEELKDLSEKLAELQNKYMEEYHVPSLEGKEDVKKGIKYQTEIYEVNAQLNKKIWKFIRENPASPVALDQAYSLIFGKMTAAEYNELIAILEPSWKGKKPFESMKEQMIIKRNMAIGEKLPDAEFFTPERKKVMLSSQLSKDKYTLVEFWASWCGPCRGEIPHLKKVKQKYPEFEIVNVSVDDSEAEWKKAMNEEKMPWLQLLSTSGFEGIIQSLYGIDGVPAGFIVDKDGKIVASDMRGGALDKFLFDTYGR